MTPVKADLPPGVVRISLPTPWPIGPVNVFLLCGEPLTLIDAGPRSVESLQALEKGLATAGVAVRDIGLVVLTHQHHDHIGNAAEIVRRSGAEVAAFAPLVQELADIDASLARERRYTACLFLRHGMEKAEVEALDARRRRDNRYTASVGVDRPLSDGDLLTAGGRTLRALHRPGHSPSDLVLFDEADGLLIAGDHLLPHISSNPLAHAPLGTPDPVAAADERTRPRPLVEYLSSLDATAALDARCVMPGHGPAFTGVARLVAARKALHERRAQELRAAVTVAPATARQLVDVLWEDLAGDHIHLGMSEVLAHLDLLADRELLRSERVDGVLYHSAHAPRRRAVA